MTNRDSVKKLIICGRKSDAIRELRALKGLSPDEARLQVEQLEKKLIASGELTLETCGKGIWGWLSSHL
ncbi:MAG: hypothetical protein JW745_07495 [Sedimentisphaerales bacterium]|nr:hypothetical protein [Sedimentisphaerales bacterium]